MEKNELIKEGDNLSDTHPLLFLQTTGAPLCHPGGDSYMIYFVSKDLAPGALSRLGM